MHGKENLTGNGKNYLVIMNMVKERKALVIRSPGTNCDEEMSNALNLAGFRAEKMHLNELFKNKSKLHDYSLLAISGGFSYGDYLGSGKVFANKLRFKLKPELKKFISEEKLILGICNGFQILVKSGLLPAINNDYFSQQGTLTFNSTGKFQCEWGFVKTVSKKSVFLKGINRMYLPIAHAEGRFLPADKNVLAEIEKNDLIALKYENNPTGTTKGIAGLTNETGLILGMMPHPERNISWLNDPRSIGNENKQIFSDGLQVFKNAFSHAKKKL